MSARAAEVVAVHTRLLKCALEVEDSRAYWKHAGTNGETPPAKRAFDEYWFGARSFPRIRVLLANFRVRFDTYPEALQVLRRWEDMDPNDRRLVCHWHLQFADPLYRSFTGEYLVARRQSPRPTITRDVTVKWVEQHGPGRWMVSTRIQFASKLLSAGFSAGLIGSNRDPRPVRSPPVGDDALVYIMYLLREVDFAGTLLDNPYVASVGLAGPGLEERLRRLPALRFGRQDKLVDFGWQHQDLSAWAGAAFSPVRRGPAGGLA